MEPRAAELVTRLRPHCFAASAWLSPPVWAAAAALLLGLFLACFMPCPAPLENPRKRAARRPLCATRRDMGLKWAQNRGVFK